VRFKLPDATTRYRIMAVAASRGAQVGAGEGAVRTHKPLLLRPLLPRVLRAGDTLAAGVSVHNDTAEPMNVEVALEVAGIELLEAAKKRVAVAAGGAAEVRFATRARQVGEAKLTFKAQGGSERDGVMLTRRVLSPSELETVSVAASSERELVRELLAPLSAVRSDVGGLDVTLSSSVLAELEQPARALLAYEYGCSEQLASRLIALAALERLRKPLGLTDEPLAKSAAPLLSELERKQRDDGSFGLWRADASQASTLSAFLTAYALIAFEQLEAAGLVLAPGPSERAKQYLAAYLRSPVRASELANADRAFVLYALALSGAYDPGYGGKLFELRAELPTFARIELAHALTHDPARKQHVDTLLNELAQALRVTGDEAHVESNLRDGYEPLMVSDVRATAQLSLLLLAHEPDHVLLPKLVHWLAGSRERDGSWATTQQSAWGLMAMASYFERKERAHGAMDVALRLGERGVGRAQLTQARPKARFQLPLRELPRAGEPIVIEKRGAGLLHYIMRLQYARELLPSEASERGFFVERSYERIDPAALARAEPFAAPALSARLGDYVRVSLRIAVPAARRFVLIRDPIPAGLTPIDLQLATSAHTAADAVRRQGPHDHQELRDDRVLFAVNELPPGLYVYTYLARASSAGTFLAPPASAEEMYHPETNGQTAGALFEVTP
jgi:uncharacterized protein YfaS (alpha-2-macroglobulin family)